METHLVRAMCDIVAMQAEIEAMKIANTACQLESKPPKYDETWFNAVATRAYGLGHSL